MCNAASHPLQHVGSGKLWEMSWWRQVRLCNGHQKPGQVNGQVKLVCGQKQNLKKRYIYMYIIFLYTYIYHIYIHIFTWMFLLCIKNVPFSQEKNDLKANNLYI